MIWTFFVLDFDGTYDNELIDSNGMEPLVYLIPLEKQKDVERCAKEAHNDFHTDKSECDYYIWDYFEDKLKFNKINFKLIGDIDLTFEERQVDYLADYIPREVV